jgi:phosphomevalonate kinase
MTKNTFENHEYLYNIATKASLHNQTLNQTKKYLISKNITDYNKIQNALIVGQVWASHMYGSPLTQQDLLVYLGNEEVIHDHKEITLDESFVGLTLNEILEIVTTREDLL